MPNIKEIREAIDTKLNAWEASASAAETLLQQTKEQALHQFEARKKRLSDTLEQFQSEVAKAKGITNENIQQIKTGFDDLRVQLALGKAETRDSCETQKKRIHHSIIVLEAIVDRQLEASGQAMHESPLRAANKFIITAISLESEMEFLAIQFEVKKDNYWAAFTHEKRALIRQINRYKYQLEEKKQMAKDKAATFESELSDGMSQIKQAFKELLG